MRSETRRSRRRTAPGLATNALTFSIVGVVVLVNSVAWGIPLLTGTDRGGSQHHAKRPVSLTTGAIPRPARRPDMPARVSAPVPLPERLLAPGMSEQSGPDATQAASPKTLYPMPEPAPAKLLQPPSELRPEPQSTREVRTVSAPRYGWRDTAMVSPYAPGFRVKPEAKAKAAPPSSPAEALARDTTLERARQIARRAAQRFEAMRARLEAPESRHQAEANGHTLPLSARQPTASLIGSSSASKSAFADVRPRIVRRPIQPDPVAEVETSPITVAAVPPAARVERRLHDGGADAAAPGSVTASSSASVAPTVPIPARHVRPLRTAGLSEPRSTPERSRSTPVTRHAEPAARSGPPPRSRTERRRARQAALRAKRRERRLASRRKPRKIDGFRPGFHRQLVSVGFFGAQR